MKEITFQDYLHFLKQTREITIGKKKFLLGKRKITQLNPKNFILERTNVWSFPKRGTWATHKGDFRGNWPPQLVRNIILRFSRPKETVLDQMCGSGTTLIECKLLGRNAIGVDINLNCILLTLDRLNFSTPEKVEIKTFVGDARNLNLIHDNTIDLIATHPPYFNIIPYSKRTEIPNDLSAFRSLSEYINAMREVAAESYRVLKPGRYCAILIGDTRRHRHHVPIAFRVMQAFLDVGFIIKEDIVKIQWKMKSTREKWQRTARQAEECWIDPTKPYDFYLLKYEHLFIFRKPKTNEKIKKFKDSIKWWSKL